TAANHFGVSDDAGVASLDVVSCGASLDAVRAHTVEIRIAGHDNVVAHGLFRELAGVLQRDVKAFAGLGDLNGLDVELHLVIGLDRGCAVSGKSRHGSTGQQCEG